jgi:hypothetical protein
MLSLGHRTQRAVKRMDASLSLCCSSHLIPVSHCQLDVNFQDKLKSHALEENKKQV